MEAPFTFWLSNNLSLRAKLIVSPRSWKKIFLGNFFLRVQPLFSRVLFIPCGKPDFWMWPWVQSYLTILHISFPNPQQTHFYIILLISFHQQYYTIYTWIRGPILAQAFVEFNDPMDVLAFHQFLAVVLGKKRWGDGFVEIKRWFGFSAVGFLFLNMKLFHQILAWVFFAYNFDCIPRGFITIKHTHHLGNCCCYFKSVLIKLQHIEASVGVVFNKTTLGWGPKSWP